MTYHHNQAKPINASNAFLIHYYREYVMVRNIEIFNATRNRDVQWHTTRVDSLIVPTFPPVVARGKPGAGTCRH